jgi:hypothetical protein
MIQNLVDRIRGLYCRLNLQIQSGVFQGKEGGSNWRTESQNKAKRALGWFGSIIGIVPSHTLPLLNSPLEKHVPLCLSLIRLSVHFV